MAWNKKKKEAKSHAKEERRQEILARFLGREGVQTSGFPTITCPCGEDATNAEQHDSDALKDHIIRSHSCRKCGLDFVIMFHTNYFLKARRVAVR